MKRSEVENKGIYKSKGRGGFRRDGEGKKEVGEAVDERSEWVHVQKYVRVYVRGYVIVLV